MRFCRCWLTGALVFSLTAAALAATHYVDVNSMNATPPFLDWTTAATNIQDAVDAAAAGEEIVVTNGVYAIGGRAVGTNVLVNRVAVDKPLSLRSVNGPQVTIIRGFKVPSWFLGCGNGAIRCVSLAAGASLSGFTLTNGATRTEGDFALEQSGGGVWCESPSAVVSNCVVTWNGAWFGGGAYGGTLIQCTLTNNTACTNGGGAYASKLTNCTITRNSSRFGEGGGVYGCTLDHCTLSSNLAWYGNGWGGGGGASYGVLNHCTLTNNSAGWGGGAYDAALTNCTLVANSAGSGGGTYAGTLNHCTLIANYATSTNWWTGGGGAAGGTLVNCLLDHNKSAGYGGGVTGNLGMEGSPLAFLVNCVLTGNSAQLGGGAYSGTLHNCTLTDNSAGTGGGANWSNLRNCIIYFNSATNSANSTQAPYGPLNYCCTWPMPTSGVGNLTNAPLFVDYTGGNLRLQSNSPCINTGTNTFTTNSTDLDGRPRIVGGTVDVGAYEFQGVGMGEFIGWLQQCGLPTDGSADFLDSDSDGHNNWQEWIAGTNPTNALSAIKLLAPTADASGVTVRWQSVTNRNYWLERATEFASSPALSIVASNLAGQLGLTSFTDATATNGGPFFYRVGVQP